MGRAEKKKGRSGKLCPSVRSLTTVLRSLVSMALFSAPAWENVTRDEVVINFEERLPCRPFSEGCRELLEGSYNCVDRTVLNAYNPLCHTPSGFRTWWHRLWKGSEEKAPKP